MINLLKKLMKTKSDTVMYEIEDNFLSPAEHTLVMDYCRRANYVWGESDRQDTPTTGLISPIADSDNAIYSEMAGLQDTTTEEIYQILLKASQKFVPDLSIFRMYINCFAAGENPHFHKDSDNNEDVTFIYYPNFDWGPDDHGETQLLINDTIYGIVPKPNRAVYFTASIDHRATSFRFGHRFTIAIKYTKK